MYSSSCPQDEFELSGTDIGSITEATVRLVEKGLGAAWHFKEVEVCGLSHPSKCGSRERWQG
jgi:hypothetical protein